jgi:ssDNA-binding Zn-finger/Zn-ribbon topoisomerase 1
MLAGGVLLESLFEPIPRVATPSIEDVSLDEYFTKFPGIVTDLLCGECGSPMQLLESGKFPSRHQNFTPFYGCTKYPHCKGTLGAHPDGTPKGIPANKETRVARIRAHAVFDQIWKTRLVKHRGAAYGWMRQAMELSKNTAHIGMFTKAQCEELIRLVFRDYPSLKTGLDRLIYDEDPFGEI